MTFILHPWLVRLGHRYRFMKPRSDSLLASLTEEQRDQLYDWIVAHSFAGAQDRADKPVSEDGFDLKIHRTTLVRFFESEQTERQARELAALAASADNATTPSAIEALEKAARDKFTRATYELAKAAADPQNYDRLDRGLRHMHLVQRSRQEIELKKRELDQEDKRIEEQRRQWEYNAARAAINHMPALQKIYNDHTLDNEDKIWAAREVCFGKPPQTSGSPLPLPDEESEVRGSESVQSAASVLPQDNSALSTQRSQLPPQGGLTHYDTLKHDNSFSPGSSVSDTNDSTGGVR